ncbi:AAA family ATPase [Candidatus Saccharibacteria bacterium]|nr:AAA family ATPase [Candidatus Saccharibacteria bacterium]
MKKSQESKLIVPIGKDEKSKKYFVDLANTQGLLICGETGIGKSMLIDSVIVSLIKKNSPDDLIFYMSDPKAIELFEFANIPHLRTEIASTPEECNSLLIKLHGEINARKVMLNEYCEEFDKTPELVVVIDEFSEFSSDEAKRFLEESLDVARKLKVHFIISTSAYLNKELDKATLRKFDYIISFDLASKDQASFLNMTGADVLSDSGEALVKHFGDLDKIQTPQISMDEIEEAVNRAKA